MATGADEHKDGFGIAFFEGAGLRLFVDHHSAAESPVAALISHYPIQSRHIVIAHIRKATQGRVALENTHPFVRELWGRYWVFAHNGNLVDYHPKLHAAFHPVGDTDSERAFCWLMQELAKNARPHAEHGRPDADAGRAAAADARHGTFNFLLSPGRGAVGALHDQAALRCCAATPSRDAQLQDADLTVDFAEHTTPQDRVAVIVTEPLTTNEDLGGAGAGRAGGVRRWRPDRMEAYLLRRLGQMVPTLAGVVLLVFFLFKGFGGDPAEILAGLNASPEQVEQIRDQLGLNRPVWEQFLRSSCSQILHFDWGRSWATNEPVAQLFATRLPATLTVMTPILVLDALLAIPFALAVAAVRGSLTDRAIMVVTTVALSDQLPGLRHRRPVAVRLPARLVPGAGLDRQRLDQPDDLRAAAGAAGGDGGHLAADAPVPQLLPRRDRPGLCAHRARQGHWASARCC